MKAKDKREREHRRDYARFETVVKEVQHQGETVADFLAKGGTISKLPAAEPVKPRKRTGSMPARG